MPSYWSSLSNSTLRFATFDGKLWIDGLTPDGRVKQIRFVGHVGKTRFDGTVRDKDPLPMRILIR